jgi:nucleotide-binding universal stress UspA family protein
MDRASGPVLVGVEDPEHVQQLVRTAGDLARVGPGTVWLVSVATKPRGSPFGVFDDETIVREFATDSRDLLRRAETPPGVSVERRVVVARSPAKGLLSVVEETDPAALVVGWRGHTGGTEAVLGSTVDTLVERAPCDLYVERVGREADGVESVLLPVAGGPHVDSAAAVAKAIAAGNDARVFVLSVATRGTEVASAAVTEARSAVTAAPGPEVPVTTAVREAPNVTDAVVTAATNHDVVVLGATRRSALRRRLVGSVPRRVVDRSDRTVLIARSGAVVGGPVARLRALLSR